MLIVNSKGRGDATKGGAKIATHVQDEISHEKPVISPPTSTGCRYHLFCSPHNRGAIAVVEELAAVLQMSVQIERAGPHESAETSDPSSSTQVGLQVLRSSTETAREAISQAKARVHIGLSLLGLIERNETKSARNSVIQVTERAEDITSCEHILVYLNGKSHESNPRIAGEVHPLATPRSPSHGGPILAGPPQVPHGRVVRRA